MSWSILRFRFVGSHDCSYDYKGLENIIHDVIVYNIVFKNVLFRMPHQVFKRISETRKETISAIKYPNFILFRIVYFYRMC